MKPTFKITMMDSLKATRKANRETQHMPKKMVTLDKKKEHNKNLCRNFKY